MKKTLVIVLALALIAILAIVLIPKLGAKPASEPEIQTAQETQAPAGQNAAEEPVSTTQPAQEEKQEELSEQEVTVGDFTALESEGTIVLDTGSDDGSDDSGYAEAGG